MSGLTATEVIDLGDYLKADFDPSTLTVKQLLGVFGYHNIKYPTQAIKKPQLIQLFNDEIKPKAKVFARQRIKRENSQASEDGITDGVTGKPLSESTLAPRRSRRISKTPAPEEEAPPETTVAPKRRRASAEPSLGGPSKRKTIRPVQATVIEESEPEEPVVRKIGRPKKKAADAATQARRVSRPVTNEPESGWEDNNVFQSGAESSSPLRPSPVRPRPRKSSVSRAAIRSRKSMSAPPQVSSPSPPKDKGKSRDTVRPPQSNFEPDLPPAIFVTRQLSVVRDMKEEDEDEEVPSEPEHHQQLPSLVVTMAEAGVEIPTEPEGGEDDELIDDNENVQAVAHRIAEGSQVIKRDIATEPPRTHWLLRVLFALLVFSSSGFIIQYKQESAEIGFCDTATNTNAILDELRTRRAAIESCNRENRTTLWLTPDSDTTVSVPPPAPTATASATGDDQSSTVVVAEPCPPPPLIPIVQPDECTPCPRHATCTPSSITCENGYILRPYPLLALVPVPSVQNGALQSYQRPSHVFAASDVPQSLYGLISYVFDGMPFVGPVAVPPRCVEDPRRKRHIGALGKAIESILANERGRRLCEGVGVGMPEGDEATEAQRWGIEIEKLREHIKKKTQPAMLSTLDDTFNEAVQQLLQWGGVFMGEDANGKRYLTHKTPMMSWDCSARVKARETWSEWRRSIIGTLTSVVSVYLFRRRQARKAVEDVHVASLVTVALDLLRNQELVHRTDPSSRPYLSSLQLRDLVLQDVHNVSRRKQLWSQVERVVESNANIRASLQEVEGGDEQRVWEWVGHPGQILTPGIPRLFGEKGQGGRPVA